MPIQTNKNGDGIIVINDFTGGINTRLSPLLLPDNTSPTATNVWVSGGLLTKRDGWRYLPLTRGSSSTANGDSSDVIDALFGLEIAGSSTGSTYAGVGVLSATGGIMNMQYIAPVRSSQASYPMMQIWAKSAAGDGTYISVLILAHDAMDNNAIIMEGSTMFPVGMPTATRSFTISDTKVSANAAFYSTTATAEYISSRGGYITFMPLTSTAQGDYTGATGVIGALPLTLESSSIGAHQASWISSGSVSSDDYPVLFNFNTNTAGNKVPMPQEIVTLGGCHYAPFVQGHGAGNVGLAVNYSDFSNNNVTGGAVCFSSGSSTQSFGPHGSSINMIEGEVSESFPITYKKPVVHKSHIFIIPASEHSLLRWSGLADGNSWPVNNSLYPGNQQGKEQLVALHSYKDVLLIVGEYKVFALIGDTFDPSNPTYSVQEIDVPGDFRFALGSTVSNHHNEGTGRVSVKFVTFTGIYTYAGGSSIFVDERDDGIRDTVSLQSRPMAIEYTASPSNVGQYSSSTNNKGIFYLSLVLDSDDRSQMFVKDERGSWWNWHSRNTLQPMDIARVIPDSRNDKLWGTVSHVNNTTDVTGMGIINMLAGSKSDIIASGYSGKGADALVTAAGAITADWKSKEFDIGYGHIYNVTVYHTKQASGNLEVTWWIDGTDSASASFDQSVGQAAAGSLVKNTIQIGQMGHSVQFKLGNSASGENFEVYKLESRIKVTPDEEIV